MSFRGICVSLLASFLFTACAMNAGREAADQAREDLDCEDITVRQVSAPSRRNQCDPHEIVVEGCGQVVQYRCESGGFGCDYTCRRIGPEDLRGS